MGNTRAKEAIIVTQEMQSQTDLALIVLSRKIANAYQVPVEKVTPEYVDGKVKDVLRASIETHAEPIRPKSFLIPFGHTR